MQILPKEPEKDQSTGEHERAVIDHTAPVTKSQALSNHAFQLSHHAVPSVFPHHHRSNFPYRIRTRTRILPWMKTWPSF